jgi:hypothetical protein
MGGNGARACVTDRYSARMRMLASVARRCEPPIQRWRTVLRSDGDERLQQAVRLSLLRLQQRMTTRAGLSKRRAAHGSASRGNLQACATGRAFMQLNTSTLLLLPLPLPRGMLSLGVAAAALACMNHWAHVAALSPVCAPSR